MLYRKFKDTEISLLAYGAMRLPVIDGDDSKIDEAKTFELIDKALASGINYFDTAWGYHKGNSEIVLGKALARHNRNEFYIASKFPGYDTANMKNAKAIFEKQLEKCGVDYFDFYLFHNVCDTNIELYLDRQYGLFDYLVEMRKQGKIRHLGFSVHANDKDMLRFLEAYGKEIEFCQIQLNWLDWELQEAEKKVKILNDWNIPIWVMEPVRGGKLAKLEDEQEKKLKALRPEESIPAWSFRFLQSVKGVTTILSGMGSDEMLEDNLKTLSEHKPLNEAELKVLSEIAGEIIGRKNLPCTGCRYCTTYCPMQLDIPALISLYNEHNFTGGGFVAPAGINALPDDKRPAACIGCRSCEAVCPQQIKISEAMADFAQKLK